MKAVKTADIGGGQHVARIDPVHQLPAPIARSIGALCLELP
jgi:hypothetical protein